MRKDEIIIAIDLPPRFRRPADWQEGTRQEGAGGERGRGLPQNTITVFPFLPPGRRRQRDTKEKEGKQKTETCLPSLGEIKKAPVAVATIAHEEKKNHWLLVGLLCDFRAKQSETRDEEGPGLSPPEL